MKCDGTRKTRLFFVISIDFAVCAHHNRRPCGDARVLLCQNGKAALIKNICGGVLPAAVIAIIFPLLHICRRLALTHAVQPIALAIVASTMVAAIKAHRLRAVVRPAVFLPGRNGFFQTHVITPLAALNNDFQIYYNTSSKRMI